MKRFSRCLPLLLRASSVYKKILSAKSFNKLDGFFARKCVHKLVEDARASPLLLLILLLEREMKNEVDKQGDAKIYKMHVILHFTWHEEAWKASQFIMFISCNAFIAFLGLPPVREKKKEKQNRGGEREKHSS